MSAYAGPEIVNSGLVLHLDAGNTNSYPGSGTTWYDLSGKNNHGTLINGPTYNNRSIVFDGINDYVDLGNNISTNFSNGKITVISFAQISTIADKNNLFSFNGAFNGFLPGNRLTTVYQLYWDGAWNNGTNANWSLNRWYHFVWIIDVTNLIFYYNNTFNGATTTSRSFNPAGQTRLGLANSAEYLRGRLGYISIYNRVLSAAEIQQNFEATRDRYGV